MLILDEIGKKIATSKGGASLNVLDVPVSYVTALVHELLRATVRSKEALKH